jgi:hypothetical protein
MTVSLANPWWHVGAFMLLPTYLLFFLSRERLRKCSEEIQNRGFLPALPLSLWQLRWYLAVGLLAFGISVALVVGTRQLFIGVGTEDKRLTLEYPWPRSDVHLNWGDVSKANMETRQFGAWGRHMFRLQVIAGSSVYSSPWSGGDADVRRAQDVIRAHLAKLRGNDPLTENKTK